MSIEAMKQALEALRNSVFDEHTADETFEAIKALEEALAKQEQGEPATLEEIRKAMIFGIALYTTPQPREWVDLTGEELETLLRENRLLALGAIWAVADKLKEKNT